MKKINLVVTAITALSFAQYAAIAAHSYPQGFAISPRDSNSATPRQPALGYNALGFGYTQNNTIYVVGRNGSRHWADPTGHLVRYTFDLSTGTTSPVTTPLVVDTQGKDVHGAGGGVTPSGAVVFFYQRSNPSDRTWIDMYAARYLNGTMTQVQIPLDGDGSFSAYGPLVVLPGGRLLQTTYGWNKQRYRVRVFASDDDGVSWRVFSVIDSNWVSRPTEAAVSLVGGTTNDNARLMAVAKSERIVNGQYASFVMQYVSRNGGKTWRSVGAIPVTVGGGTVSPWLATISRGRIALVWPDRVNNVLCVSVAKTASVFTNPRGWPKPRWVYRSRLWGHPGSNHSDFGYPAVVSTSQSDSDVYVLFYDSHNGDSGMKPYDIPSDTDIMSRPLFAPDIRESQ